MKPGNLAALLALAAIPAAAAGDWPMLARNPERHAATPEVVRPPYRLAWKHAFGEMVEIRVEPIVARGKVLVGTYAGRLHALAARDGKSLWTFQTGGPILHSPCVADGTVYLTSHDRHVYAVSLSAGRQKWKFRTGAGVWSSPLLFQATVFVTGRDGVCYALDATTGREIWRFNARYPIYQSPAIDTKTKTLFFGAEDMTAYALRCADGKPLWRKRIVGQSFRDYYPVVAAGAVIFFTMPVHGHAQHGRNPGSPAAFAEAVAKDPTVQTMFALDAKTGRELRKHPVIWNTGGGGVMVPGAVGPDGKMYLNLPQKGRTYMAPMPFGWLDLTTGRMKVLGTRSEFLGAKLGWGQARIIGDETNKFTLMGSVAAGKEQPVLLNSHHDVLTAFVFDPPKGHHVLGKSDCPALPDAPQWYANHDNHPSFHSATVADGRIFWLNQGDWLFAVEHKEGR